MDELKAHAARIAVPNGIVYILDPGHPDVAVPRQDPRHVVSSSPSCVSVSTVPEVDGNLEVSLRSGQAPEGAILAFVGRVETPTGTLAIVTGEHEVVLVLHGLRNRVGVQVYVNRLHLPDQITVLAT